MLAFLFFFAPGLLAALIVLYFVRKDPLVDRILYPLFVFIVPLVALPIFLYKRCGSHPKIASWAGFLGFFIFSMLFIGVLYPLTPEYTEQRAIQLKEEQQKAEQEQLEQIEKQKQEAILAKQEAENAEKAKEANFRWPAEKTNLFVETAQKAGLIDSYELDARKVYVNPAPWMITKAKEKELFAQILSEFFGRQAEVGGPASITIIDAYSGKELASYSLLWGFKVKD